MPAPIVIAGGSGFVGTSLAAHLSALGHPLIILTRRPKLDTPAIRQVRWDARSPGDWIATLDNAAGLINLVGRSVDCIKTPDHADEILRSRVESTAVLGVALRQLKNPPPVWVQMSTAHICGDPPEVWCDEFSPPGYGLAPEVAQAWEAAFHGALLPTQRGVLLRTSFVLGRNRGAGQSALARLAFITRLGLGGRVGPGTQGISWIHEHDLNQLFARALTTASMTGPYIASAPNPVSQAQFMKTLRRTLKMPIGLPAPAWLTRLGARYFMRTDPELALYGRYVTSTRLKEEGFSFAYPTLLEALGEIFCASAS